MGKISEVAELEMSAHEDRPPLAPGDRLTRAEFERRYHAHPEIKKAELIEGVVYMPSPVHHKRHGGPHFALGGWLVAYVAATPGIEGSDNATVRLDNQNEVQPDLLLRLREEYGGNSCISADDYIAGPPELVIEIAATSANYDMHDKRQTYARSGVQEYLLVLTYDRAVHWFALHDGEYVLQKGDADGNLYSKIFPGLCLNVEALWAQDLTGLLSTLQQGLASSEHTEFVKELSPS